MTDLVPTAGQTVGPFFGFALPYEGGNELVPPTHPQAIRLHGRVLGGDGQPVPDAVIELWQAEPGTAPAWPGGVLRDFARGLLDRLFTRAYLPGDSSDPLLDGLDADRRATPVTVPDGERGLRFDIRLQGDGETVFHDLGHTRWPASGR